MKDGFTNGFDVPDDQKERHYDVFEEVVLLSRYLQKHGVLKKITEQVRFARKRFGRYEVIDFLAVLFGYAISGERTLDKRLTFRSEMRLPEQENTLRLPIVAVSQVSVQEEGAHFKRELSNGYSKQPPQGCGGPSMPSILERERGAAGSPLPLA